MKPGFNVEHGEMDIQMMSKFRSGTYAGHEKGVKQAWLFFARILVGAVNGEWKDEDCVRHQLMSEATHESDEALVSWVMIHYRERWIREKAEDTTHRMNGTTRPRRCRPKGTAISTQHMSSYYAVKRKIAAERARRVVANEWEEAIKVEAILDHQTRMGIGDDGSTLWTVEDDGRPPPTAQELVNNQLVNGIRWEDLRAV